VFDKFRERPSVRKLIQDASEVPDSLAWLLNSEDGLWLEEVQLALSGNAIVKLVDMPPSAMIMQGDDRALGNFWVFETASTLKQRRQRPQLWDMLVFIFIPFMRYEIVTGSRYGLVAQTAFWCLILLVPLASVSVYALMSVVITLFVGLSGQLLAILFGGCQSRISRLIIGKDKDFELENDVEGSADTPHDLPYARESPHRGPSEGFLGTSRNTRAVEVHFTLGADSNGYIDSDWELIPEPQLATPESFDSSLRATGLALSQ
jgi:hypothetical protein